MAVPRSATRKIDIAIIFLSLVVLTTWIYSIFFWHIPEDPHKVLLYVLATNIAHLAGVLAAGALVVGNSEMFSVVSIDGRNTWLKSFGTFMLAQWSADFFISWLLSQYFYANPVPIWNWNTVKLADFYCVLSLIGWGIDLLCAFHFYKKSKSTTTT